MKIVVAPSALKGTIDAFEASAALASAVREALPEAALEVCPLADGGSGTASILSGALGGEKIPVSVTGPAGEQVEACFFWLPTDIAAVEMASASGLALVKGRPDPLGATSRGTGEVIARALDRSPRRIIVAAGDSATSDAGAGLLQALGVGFLDGDGEPVGPGARGLLTLAHIDVSGRDPRILATEFVVACDVDNPLLGEQGAARVFSPQKGATDQQVGQIDEALTRFAEVAMADLGKWVGETLRGGAAGGAAAGMRGVLGAELVSGFDLLASETGFEDSLRGADLLIVAEGRLDEQSLSGKAPVAAARMAREMGIEVWVFCGEARLSSARLGDEGVDRVFDLSAEQGGRSRSEATSVLVEAASGALRERFA
jgi:glycerate kinase